MRLQTFRVPFIPANTISVLDAPEDILRNITDDLIVIRDWVSTTMMRENEYSEKDMID